ncbi:MAG: hypothetical protein J6W06_06685 [Bacteroidales bacterium]|nr:hypothetical protein [Bacteroidales bacterium]
MSYIYFNPNPSGKRVGDCVIRAISRLTGSSWETTYIGIATKGYEMFDMPSSNAVWAEYLKERGYRRVVIPDTCPQCYSVREFCHDNPKGRYLLATGSHVVTAIDGDYYDAWDSGAEVPVYFWTKE